jgi:hypothetical protein
MTLKLDGENSACLIEQNWSITIFVICIGVAPIVGQLNDSADAVIPQGVICAFAKAPARAATTLDRGFAADLNF